MKRYIFCLLVLSLLTYECSANKRYWISSVPAYWNNAANWSSSSGGAGGAGVPGSNDTAYFDGALITGSTYAVGNDTLDANVNVKWISISAGYTGTIVQRTYTVTLGTTGGTFAGGTFAGGSGSITSTGAITISATAFTSTSGTLSTNSNFTLSGSGSFTHNSGTVTFTASNSITGTIGFNHLTFNAAATATYAITNTITANGTLTLSGSQVMAFSGGNIDAKGDITLSNTANSTSAGGTTNININGAGSQTMTGNSTKGDSRLPNVVINKSTGTLTLASIITVQGNFTHTNGTITPGSSTIHFAGTKTISGTFTIHTISFGSTSSPTYTVSNTITAGGNFETQGSGTITINTGTINVAGDLTIAHTGASSGGGTATIVINGSGDQLFTGSGTAGQGRLPNITISKSDTLTLASIISVDANWTYSSGTVVPGTSGVAFYGNYNLDGQGASSTMQFYRIQIASGTRTLTGNVDANENFSILTGATCVAGSYTINVGGNWNSQGTWTYNTSTVVFDGTDHNVIRGVAGTVQFANVVINRNANQKSVTLNNPVQINTSLTLAKGRVKTTTTNILSFVDNATCTVTNNDSAYVHGPVLKTGNDAFTFPLGDTTLADNVAYHPLSMTAPGSATDQFQATYRPIAQTCGSAKASTLTSVSSCQFWTIDRVFGSSAPTITLGWNSNCDNTAFAEMRVAEWTGAQWTDRGQASTSISHPTGTVTATTALSFTSDPDTLVIAYAAVDKAYAVLNKSEPAGGYHTTNGYVLYFGFEDEYDDQNDSLSFTVTKISTDRTQTMMPNSANRPLVYYGMNRYKLDLYDNSNTPLASGYYMLEVTNSRNEKYYLRFKI